MTSEATTAVIGTDGLAAILRLGYGPQGPRTPRRPVDQVLTITE